MAYRFATRSVTPGDYRLVSGFFAGFPEGGARWRWIGGIALTGEEHDQLMDLPNTAAMQTALWDWRPRIRTHRDRRD